MEGTWEAQLQDAPFQPPPPAALGETGLLGLPRSQATLREYSAGAVQG
jgi:hypothetical protein